MHIIARDLKEAVTKAKKQLGEDVIFPESFLKENPDFIPTTLEIKNVVLLTNKIII
jgi:hypothetical protein